MKFKNHHYIYGLLFALIFAPLWESCKRGPDDPGLSLRSRNARITGTWELKSEETVYRRTTYTHTTNDVNDNEFERDWSLVEETTFDGDIRTIITNTVEDVFQRDRTYPDDYDFTDSIWNDPNTADGSLMDTYEEMNSTETYDYSVEISLYKDNTFTMTRTISAATVSESQEFKYVDGGTTFSEEWDTTYAPVYENTIIRDGTWGWRDDSKKSKLYLEAGNYMYGFVVQLRHDELILDPSFVDQDMMTNETDPTHQEDSLYTFNDDMPEEKELGTVTTFYEEMEEMVSGQTVWEKLDNDSKREDLGEE